MKTAFFQRSLVRAVHLAAFLLTAASYNLPAASFANPGRIAILDHTNASPFPAEIMVEGLAGRITSVTATLAELGAQFKRPTSTMDLWLNRLGLSCKKGAARLRAVAARRGGTKKAVAPAAGGGARRATRVLG